MAASTSAEAGLLMEHPTRGCSLLGGPHRCPEPGEHAAATQGDGDVFPPRLPGSGAGKRVLPPPRLPSAHHTDGDLAALVLVSAAQEQVLAAPRLHRRGEELQLWLRGSGGMSNVLVFIWVFNFSPQALLQSATRSVTTEDGTDFTRDRYAYI